MNTGSGDTACSQASSVLSSANCGIFHVTFTYVALNPVVTPNDFVTAVVGQDGTKMLPSTVTLPVGQSKNVTE